MTSARPGAERAHRRQRRLCHLRDRAPPAGVHAGQHVRGGVVQDDRHAVGHQDRQHGSRLGGDQGVGWPGRIAGGQRAAAPVGGGHDLGAAAVNLGGEDEGGRGGAESSRDPAPVLRHGRRLVANGEAEVERGVAARRNPAVAGGDHGLDRQRAENRPGQDLQARSLAEPGGRGRGWCCHRLDLSAAAARPRPVPPARFRPRPALRAPPWILVYLVTGRRGLRGIWPLPVVGSLSYILGQFPTSQFLGPYLPDIVGALVSFGALLLLLRYWRPAETLGYGGVPIAAETVTVGTAAAGTGQAGPGLAGTGRRAPGRQAPGRRMRPPTGNARGCGRQSPPSWRSASSSWSSWPRPDPGPTSATTPSSSQRFNAVSSLSHQPVSVVWKFAPAVAGSWILVSLLVILAVLKVGMGQFGAAVKRSFSQTWGALLVAPIVFGLATVFNYSGMASTLAYGFSRVGTWFILLAPLLGWIGVALSGSNTSTNALFGGFQYAVGGLLHMPLLLLPSLNSAGAEVGKPIAPQTTSVGVSTSSYVRREGEVIRHNFGWTLVILGLPHPDRPVLLLRAARGHATVIRAQETPGNRTAGLAGPPHPAWRRCRLRLAIRARMTRSTSCRRRARKRRAEGAPESRASALLPGL